MINRFIDPYKINPVSDCIEIDPAFSGEIVEDGKLIYGFEFVEAGRVNREGVEIVGDFRDRMGFHVTVEGIGDESAQALESLLSEVISRMRGVEYRFRKENVMMIVSSSSFQRFTPECVGEVIFRAVKSIKAIKKVKVRIVCDGAEFEAVKKRAAKVHEQRESKSKSLRDENVREFYLCESCKVYLPYHACVITPERPSPCGTLYSEAKSASELEIVEYYSPVHKGKEIDAMAGEYENISREIKKKTESKVERIKIHSVLENPPLTGNFAEAILFYIPDDNGFGIVDRSFKGKTPLGLRFSNIERFIAGLQVEGFTGISLRYLKSESFLKGEGGWKKVTWVSPKIYEFVSRFLPKEILERMMVQGGEGVMK